MTLPTYVETRLRQKPPAEAPIVSGSTPVLSFGNPMTAKIATLGLNPSDKEFLDRDGLDLECRERRLETLTSLNVKSLIDAPLHVLEAVVDGCNGYFQKCPYSWFRKLEFVLQECGTSYYNGTACHLDLVQWATDSKWSEIWDGVRAMLLRDDFPFLLEQLQNSNIKTLLLNGNAVVKEFSAMTKIKLVLQPKKITGKTKLFVGRGPRNILVVGWSTNLQNSYGVSNEWRKQIAQAVAAVVMEHVTV